MMLFGTFILIIKFGNAAAYGVLYAQTTSMFPVIFSVTAFGIS